MLKDSLFEIISRLLNRYLKLDNQSEVRLKRLRGKITLIELRPLNIHFTIKVVGDTLLIAQNNSDQYDAKITGTPIRLLNLSLNKKNRQTFFSDDVTLEGDVHVAQQIMDLFDKLSIDWEEEMSHIIGDIPTHHVTQTFKKINKLFSEADHSFTQNVDEYIHEEMQWLPTRAEVESFNNEVDDTRMAADRLAEKIKFMQKELGCNEA